MKKKIIVKANPKPGTQAEAHRMRANIRKLICSIFPPKIKTKPPPNG